MKYLFIILTLVFSVELFSQESTFFNAIKNGENTSIENFFSNRVELCIFENQQMLSKKVASDKLGQFLNDNKVTKLEVIHQGTSKDKTSNFKVAKLTTNKGVYRMFLYFTGSIENDSIKELRIDNF